MNEKLTIDDYERLLKFNNLIQNNHMDNFQYYTLELLHDLFKIERSAFYTFSNGKMTNITVFNYTEDVMNEYMQDISHNDIVFNHIRENKHSYNFPYAVTLMDILKNKKYKNRFINSAHHSFFMKNNIYYEMSLILNSELDTISWERSLEEGKYTEKDKALATHLCNIIASNYRLIKENSLLKDEIGLFHMSKESLNFGLMIFDKNMELINFNKIAIDYCLDITNTYSLNGSINEIKKIIFSNENMKEMYHSRFLPYKSIKPYVYEVSTLRYFDQDNIVKTYFMVNIYHCYWFSKINKINNNIKKYNLTEREKEITMEILKGLRNEDIADKLCISINTVKMHIKNIYKKLDVNSKVSLITKINNHYDE